MLTSEVVPAVRSRTNTSRSLFVSPFTRFDAAEEKATTCPSALIDGSELGPFACLPPPLTLTRVVFPVARSFTNTSAHGYRPRYLLTHLLVSPATRFEA